MTVQELEEMRASYKELSNQVAVAKQELTISLNNLDELRENLKSWVDKGVRDIMVGADLNFTIPIHDGRRIDGRDSYLVYKHTRIP